MIAQPPRWFVDEPDRSPWLKALEDVRSKATREGWCYNMSRQSSLRLTSTQKPPQAIESTF